jgi:DNA-binding transcriptional regulator YiaG
MFCLGSILFVPKDDPKLLKKPYYNHFFYIITHHKIKKLLYLCARKYKLSINMSKTTMGNKLPRKLEQKMQTVGEQIKLARLRRNLSVVQVAERATCSPLTVSRIEKGTPTVAIGIYLRVLYALQLDDDILLLAQKDEMGRALQDLALKHRERASKKQ